MKGIEQARKFYTEVGIKMIADEFGDYQNRIAVGLVGHGSTTISKWVFACG